MKPRILLAGPLGDVLPAALGEAAEVIEHRDLRAASRALRGVDAVVLGLTEDTAAVAADLLAALPDDTPVALATPRATLRVISDFYLLYPQIAPLVETENLSADGAAQHVVQLSARIAQRDAPEAADDLVFGSYFAIPRGAADYREQRSLSLVSPSMQDFLEDLRDAVVAMRRPAQGVPDAESGELVMPPIPWDPYERSEGMDDPGSWRRVGDRVPNLRRVLDNASHKNAQALLRTDGSAASEAELRAFDKPPHLLILGDSGTGKTMVARLVHELFRNQAGEEYGGSVARPREMPFVEVNCGGMTITNFDHRMHGAVTGTYTEARNVGQLVRAAYGVAFFDELGDLGYEAQARLLMYLEDGRVTPEGMSPFFGFSRVIAATNRDLGELVRTHRFRHDLLARFGKRVRLPSLAARGPADRERLIDFVALNPSVNPAGEKRFVPRMSREAVDILKAHDFAAGNFRELETVVHQALERARRRHSGRVEAGDVRLDDPDVAPGG